MSFRCRTHVSYWRRGARNLRINLNYTQNRIVGMVFSRAKSKQQLVREYYRALYRALGPQHWWPGRTRFEVIVGAYLTQNTAWTNVAVALARLRAAGKLSLAGIRNISLPELETLLRPAGYYRQKARSLKTFVEFLDKRYGGSLTRMFAEPTLKLRQELLLLKGVGPETADTILLYAGQHEIFVVDAYTRRILERHRITSGDGDYEEIRALVESSLAAADAADPACRNREATPTSNLAASAHTPFAMSNAPRSPVAQAYNEMHGLLVSAGKHYCLKSKPQCDLCPLRPFLP
jgi:endonuclease-3 related protein